MGDFRRGNASFQVEFGVFEAKMRDFHLNGGFSKRKCMIFFFRWGIFIEKRHDFCVKSGIFAKKKKKRGVIFGLNRGFLKRKCVIFG